MHCQEQHEEVTCQVKKKIQVYVDSVITNPPVSDRKIQEMHQETKYDEQLQKLKKTFWRDFQIKNQKFLHLSKCTGMYKMNLAIYGCSNTERIKVNDTKIS